jgi:two-component system, sensor histidine kinase RpfC
MKLRLPFNRASMSPEKEMLLNRLCLGFAAGAANYFYEYDPRIFAAFLTYLSANAALFVMQRASVWRDEERRFAAIIMDATMGMVVMLCDPEGMSFTYPLFLWMILGNGFRFGLKWLFVAAGLGALAFGMVVYKTEYWSTKLILGYSLAAGLFVIPAYCSTLIRKISLAKEQAEIASRAKSYFLTSVSHELRTPLNAILGYGNHLQQMNLPKNQRDMIDASVLAGEHLLHLIEQLIQVAKTDTGAATVTTGSFRTTDILSEIRDIMAVRAEEKGLSLHIQAETLSDRMIEGPADFVRNILLNLAGNAVKFTEAGVISICGGLNDDGPRPILWLTVTDTGIGIADNAQEIIFQPFQQADDTVLNRFGGTGLGLAICKQLVEQVGGTISVDSKIGIGSIFRVTIPVDFASDHIAVNISHDNKVVKILSLGQFETGLLASAQSAGNFSIRHIACDTIEDIEGTIGSVSLGEFQVAMIDQRLANMLKPDSHIWEKFAAAEVAPVLVAHSDGVDLEDIALRAAFATVIPASPNFDELRSAIRIGCSFAKHPRFSKEDVQTTVVQYAPRSVLVADDNRTNRNVLSAILESAGHRVTMVTDGDEALDALEKGGFDVLLLDVNMPRLNGIDACRMWRQIEGGRAHIPILGVTADATAETEQNCLNAGMDLRITKPVDAKKLLAMIDHYCGGTAIDDAPVKGDPFGVVVPLTKMTENMPAIDPAQLEYLYSIGDQSFVTDMIESFFEDIAETSVAIERAVAANDVTQFRFCAHAYKSSANNIGAKVLATLCGRYEKVTEADFTEHAELYLKKIIAEVTRVKTALKAQTIQPSRGNATLSNRA